jgi:serine/threonine-protein kinase
VRTLIARCLVKDPRQRLRDIGEARVQLEELLAGDSDESAAPGPPSPPSAATRPAWTHAVPWAAAAAASAIALAAVLIRPPADAPADRPLVNLDVNLGEDVSLGMTNSSSNVIISPDGTRVAWMDNAGGSSRLFTRRLDQVGSTQLAGTEGASAPRFSPDGLWIAFYARDAFSSVSVDGGAVVPLGRVGAPAGITWQDPDSVLVSEAFARGLVRLPVNGGAAEQVVALPPGTSAIAHPFVLPNDRGILLVADAGKGIEEMSIEVVAPANGQRTVVARGGASARYLETGAGTGHLIYSSRATLFATPFDLRTLQALGPAVPMVSDLAYSGTGTGQFDVSRTGTLVYSRARARAKTTVQWLDPAGKTQPVVSSAAPYQLLPG